MDVNIGTIRNSLDAEKIHRTNEIGKVKVLWDNGKEAWDPVPVIRKDDQLEMTKCAHDNKLNKING